MSTISVGIAPIGWTNDDMPELGGETPYQQILSEAALAGFTGTEIGNKYPKQPEVLLCELGMRGIKIAASWFGVFFTTNDYAEEERRFRDFVAYMVALNADCINICEQGHSVQGVRDVGVFEGKPTFTGEEWERLTTGLDQFGAIANDHGIRLAYHHHMGTGVMVTSEIDRLMENTDPDKLKLLVDVGHLIFAGQDPKDIITRYLPRVGHVHMKDVRPDVLQKAREQQWSFLDSVLNGVFTVPGDGPTDYHQLLQPVVDSDYEGWFMVEAEQDPAKANPLEYALIARKYVSEQLGL